MLSIHLWHSATSIFSHSTCTLFQSSVMPFAGSGYFASLLLRRNHRCSMGLRSGDWAGHTMTSNPCSANHFLAFLLVYLRSLSCWKTYHLEFCQNTPGFARVHPPQFVGKGQYLSYHQSCMPCQPLPMSYNPTSSENLLQTWLFLVPTYNLNFSLPFSTSIFFHLTQCNWFWSCLTI